MTALRQDIADAATRMRVTFGTRTAMKHLARRLQSGEEVKEMAACTFAGSQGLLVLTDRRLLAVRDDYSSFRLRDCPIGDITCLDYAPTVHDGLAAFTHETRVAVRKMNIEDSDRLATALLVMRPDVAVTALTPGSVVRPVARARPTQAGPDSMASPAPATTRAVGEGPPAPATFGMPFVPPDRPEAERDALIGVLADLHARGLLSSEELAQKTSMLSA